MAILRTAECDICKLTVTESDYGLGWASWVQVSGLGKEREPGHPHKHSDSNIMLCPEHGAEIAKLLNDMEKLYKKMRGEVL